MGEVYRARDTRIDRIVAIKILPDRMADSALSRERFEREARALASLNHPDICAIYDVGHQDGIEYLVMEYVEGETLASRLLPCSIPVEEVLQYAIKIADALDQTHRKGIMHRDLKPANIMLRPTALRRGSRFDRGLHHDAGHAAGNICLNHNRDLRCHPRRATRSAQKLNAEIPVKVG